VAAAVLAVVVAVVTLFSEARVDLAITAMGRPHAAGCTRIVASVVSVQVEAVVTDLFVFFDFAVAAARSELTILRHEAVTAAVVFAIVTGLVAGRDPVTARRRALGAIAVEPLQRQTKVGLVGVSLCVK